MPIYEYQCESCEHRFERLQRLDDPPLKTCEECEGPVRKLISAPAFQFKGTGWYVTDYARKGAGGGGASDSSSKSEDKSTAKADKKDKTDKTEKKESKATASST